MSILTPLPTRPSHHANDFKNSFRNPWPSAESPTWGELLQYTFPLGLFEANLAQHSHARKLKLLQPDWGVSSLASPSLGKSQSNIIGTWLGHSGALVELPVIPDSNGSGAERDTLYLLFDPIFAQRAGPAQYVGPSRLIKSPCKTKDLPGCDAVFISHNHYDHLDLPTVQEILNLFPSAKWFVPLANKKWLVETGVDPDKVTEMDWWESWEGGMAENELHHNAKAAPRARSGFGTAIKISCVPAQHNSGRAGWDQGNTLWSGWIIERFIRTKSEEQVESMARSGVVYHAGDTGYRRSAVSDAICPAFQEIGKRFGPIDLSFIPIWRGGTLGFISTLGLKLSHHDMPSSNHCSPKDAVAIHQDVRSRNTIGVHFGTFVGSENESYEAMIELRDACVKAEVGDIDDEGKVQKGRAGILDIGGSLAVQIDGAVT